MYLYINTIVVATCETPKTVILSLSLSPVQGKAAEPEEPVQDDDESDGQGGDVSEQSDDHESDDHEQDDQDVDNDDHSDSESMDDGHGQSHDVVGDDQSGDEDDDGQSQSQDVGDKGVEESQKSHLMRCLIVRRPWFFLGRGEDEDPAPSPMQVDTPCSPSAEAQTDVESDSSSVHSISTPDFLE